MEENRKTTEKDSGQPEQKEKIEPQGNGRERKPLTEAQKQKLKKIVVIPMMCLACLGCIYLIFSPSEDAEKREVKGFNATIPQATEKGLAGNKEKAYEQEEMAEKNRQRLRTLDDFVFDSDSAASNGQVLNSYFSAPDKKNPDNPVLNSRVAYQDAARQLNDFYRNDPQDNQQQLALEYQIQELERALSEKDESKTRQEEQLAMMEKSYQMAAKYINPQVRNTAPVQVSAGKESSSQKVKGIGERAVSGLEQAITDSMLVANYTQPRNMGFNTAVGTGYSLSKNTIRACVNETTTLTDGQPVRLRLLEAMQAGRMVIPANSLVTGQAKISGERLDIIISSLEYKGNIIPVELTVYDMDGQQGICVPGSMEINAAKEVAANLGSSLGTSLTITQNAGSQLAADLGKGLIQGTSQYLGKKFRTVKITLKANYLVMLYAKE